MFQVFAPDRPFLARAKREDLVHSRLRTAGSQQLDGRNFQRVALHLSADIHAKAILFVGRLYFFHDFLVPAASNFRNFLSFVKIP